MVEPRVWKLKLNQDLIWDNPVTLSLIERKTCVETVQNTKKESRRPLLRLANCWKSLRSLPLDRGRSSAAAATWTLFSWAAVMSARASLSERKRSSSRGTKMMRGADVVVDGVLYSASFLVARNEPRVLHSWLHISLWSSLWLEQYQKQPYWKRVEAFGS